jgi:hypothetical protein
MKQKAVLKDKKEIRTQINGKCNGISSVDENKLKKIYHCRVFV